MLNVSSLPQKLLHVIDVPLWGAYSVGLGLFLTKTDLERGAVDNEVSSRQKIIQAYDSFINCCAVRCCELVGATNLLKLPEPHPECLIQHFEMNLIKISMRLAEHQK